MKDYSDYSKVAARSDLQSEKWKVCFSFLEKEQAEFSSVADSVCLDEYYKKWPKDSLYSWSRIWEYPYVYSQLDLRCRNLDGTERLKVVDFGAGVSFFPFSVAKFNVDLFCVDNDPVVVNILKSIKSALTPGQSPGFGFRPIGAGNLPGVINASSKYGPNNQITPVLVANDKLPFDDNSVDILYSISVIEHLENWQNVISEFFRVLKKDSICILTFDISLSEGHQLDTMNFMKFNASLMEKFELVLPEKSIHPCDLLTTGNSPFPYKDLPFADKIKYSLKHRLFPFLLGRKPSPRLKPFCIGVQGLTIKPLK